MNHEVHNPIFRTAILQVERLRPFVASLITSKLEYKTLPAKVENDVLSHLLGMAMNRTTVFAEIKAYNRFDGSLLLDAVRQMSHETEKLSVTSDKAGALAWAMGVYLLLRFCVAHGTNVPPEVVRAFVTCLKIRLKEYMENLP